MFFNGLHQFTFWQSRTQSYRFPSVKKQSSRCKSSGSSGRSYALPWASFMIDASSAASVRSARNRLTSATLFP